MFILKIIQNTCICRNIQILFMFQHMVHTINTAALKWLTASAVRQCHCCTLTIPYRAPLSTQTLPQARSGFMISKRGTFLFLLKQGGNYTSEIFIIHMVTLMKVVINLQYHSLKMIYPLLVQRTIIPHFIFNDYMTQKASVFFTKLLKNIKL